MSRLPWTCRRSRSPPRNGSAFAGGDLSQGSLYGLLEMLCGLRISGGREWLRAVTCNQAERKLLRPGRGEGVFEVERVAYAGDHARRVASQPGPWRRLRHRRDLGHGDQRARALEASGLAVGGPYSGARPAHGRITRGPPRRHR